MQKRQETKKNLIYELEPEDSEDIYFFLLVSGVHILIRERQKLMTPLKYLPTIKV